MSHPAFLCGSKNYPVRDPQKTYATFIGVQGYLELQNIEYLNWYLLLFSDISTSDWFSKYVFLS